MNKQIFSFFLIIAIVFTGNITYAQADTAKANKAKAELIDAVCTCISKKDTSTIKTADDMENLLQTCFMGDGLMPFMQYMLASGVDMSDMQKMQSISEKLWMELAVQCPALIKITMNVTKDEKELQKLMDKKAAMEKIIQSN